MRTGDHIVLLLPPEVVGSPPELLPPLVLVVGSGPLDSEGMLSPESGASLPVSSGPPLGTHDPCSSSQTSSGPQPG
jgi:hypothetical protein